MAIEIEQKELACSRLITEWNQRLEAYQADTLAHARALPAPGPATIRLALLRTSLELYGAIITRQELFPVVRAAPIRIQPPEQIAMTQHLLRGHKWEQEKKTKQEQITDSLMLRELAHASGPMRVSLSLPASEENRFRTLLQAVGYWGQTDSLTTCEALVRQVPHDAACAHPLRLMSSHFPIQQWVSCLLSEFRAPFVAWDEVVADRSRLARKSPLLLEIYVWPLILKRTSHTGKLLIRQSFDSKMLGEGVSETNTPDPRKEGFF